MLRCWTYNQRVQRPTLTQEWLTHTMANNIHMLRSLSSKILYWCTDHNFCQNEQTQTEPQKRAVWLSPPSPKKMWRQAEGAVSQMTSEYWTISTLNSRHLITCTFPISYSYWQTSATHDWRLKHVRTLLGVLVTAPYKQLYCYYLAYYHNYCYT